MMNFVQAKAAVNSLLAATGIKAVYYVDDKFQEDTKIVQKGNSTTSCIGKSIKLFT